MPLSSVLHLVTHKICYLRYTVYEYHKYKYGSRHHQSELGISFTALGMAFTLSQDPCGSRYSSVCHLLDAGRLHPLCSVGMEPLMRCFNRCSGPVERLEFLPHQRFLTRETSSLILSCDR